MTHKNTVERIINEELEKKNDNAHNIMPKVEGYFYLGHARAFWGVSRRTVYRWLSQDKVRSVKDGMSGYHLFSLEEVNRVLQEQHKPQVSFEEAKKIWETY